MKFVLLLAAVVGWWAWKRRGTQALRIGDVTAVVAALVAMRLGMKGQILPAIAGLGGAAWWYWFRRSAALPAEAMPLEEARRLLGVDRAADEAEVRAAHRRLLARVHPDVGGSAELAAQVNAARDALLSQKI